MEIMEIYGYGDFREEFRDDTMPRRKWRLQIGERITENTYIKGGYQQIDLRCSAHWSDPRSSTLGKGTDTRSGTLVKCTGKGIDHPLT